MQICAARKYCCNVKHSNAKRIQEAVKEAGAYLDGKLPPHPGLAKRNSFAHLWERIKHHMEKSYKECEDEEVDEVLSIVEFYRNNLTGEWQKPKSETLIIKPWVYLESMGDGSAAVRFFNSQKDADKYAEHHDERLCDDIYCKKLVIDLKTGKILNVDVPEEDEEEDDE